MDSTKISLIVPRTIAKQGDYEVSLDGKTAKINILYFQNNKSVDEIMGVVTTGFVTLEPDDPEGWTNISKITIELPYLVSSVKSADDSMSGFSHPSLQSPFKEATVESVRYLNRLIEVIRYCTRRYWMRYVSEAQIKIYEVELSPENDKGRQLYVNAPPLRPSFPVADLDESIVKSDITAMLKNEFTLPKSENLYFDAMQYFSYSRYNESVIYANIALEVFIEEDLRRRYTAEGDDKATVSKKVSKLFSKHYSNGGLRSLVKEAYFTQANDQDQNAIMQKLDYSRIKRKNTIHPFTTRISEDEARSVLINIFEITQWLYKSSNP